MLTEDRSTGWRRACRPSATPRGEASRGRAGSGRLLFFALAAQLAVGLALGATNSALPILRRDLNLGSTGLQWVALSYQLGYGAVLVTAGRLGDVFGYRRLFVFGVVLFIAASIGAAMAPTAGMLLTARSLQGIAGGLLAPQILALIQTTTTGEKRVSAVGKYAIVSASAYLIGQAMTAAVISIDPFGLGWRFAFLLICGVAIVGGAGAGGFPANSIGRTSVDVLGATLLALAIVALVYPLIQIRTHLSNPTIYAVLALCCLAALALVHVERRALLRGRTPVIDVSLFRQPRFRTGMAINALMTSISATVFLLVGISLQEGFGFSPMLATIATCGSPLAVMASNRWSARLASKYGVYVFVIAAGLMTLSHALVVAVASFYDRTGLWLLMLVSMIPLGVGIGLGLPAAMHYALGDIPPSSSGTGAGMYQTFQQICGVLGVAVFGFVYFSGDMSSRAEHRMALLNTSLLTLAGFVLMCALCWSPGRAQTPVRAHVGASAGRRSHRVKR